jgi:hypothetical protein
MVKWKEKKKEGSEICNKTRGTNQNLKPNFENKNRDKVPAPIPLTSSPSSTPIPSLHLRPLTSLTPSLPIPLTSSPSSSLHPLTSLTPSPSELVPPPPPNPPSPSSPHLFQFFGNAPNLGRVWCVKENQHLHRRLFIVVSILLGFLEEISSPVLLRSFALHIHIRLPFFIFTFRFCSTTGN